MKKTAIPVLLVASALATHPAQAERGGDGELKILYWQAVSILNPYLSSGTKDIESSSLIIEPLARYNPAGEMVPYLVEEIPTVDNGGVAEDLKSITWKLKKDIKWSDGSDFTAEDVVFTAEYCMHPEGGCQQSAKFTDVETVEAVDSHTVKITYSVAKPFPYGPFVGAEVPVIQKAQFAECLGTKSPECTEQNFGPHGTGPFRVTEFKANDVITMEANPHYRDPTKPAFATVLFKGGGDAASAARSVLETGEFDYAWNLQIEPEILNQMASAGKGEVISAFGTSVERIMINFTDPNPELGDKRATVDGGAHPFLTDNNVTRALSLAIDRDILVEVGYGSSGRVTCNVLPAPEYQASTNNDWCKQQDVEQANKLLDDAGWVRGDDGIREKDGVRMSILYQTSTNPVRQAAQALIKQMWEAIGVETELRNIDGAVFFGGDQSSPDTFQKFFADVEMYTNNFNGTDAEKYMGNWACSEIPSPETQWLGMNMPRYCNSDYDALLQKMAMTSGVEERGEVAKQLNDMLMEAGAIIPLIHRGRVSARSNTLQGVQHNAWDSEMWNAADWTRAE